MRALAIVLVSVSVGASAGCINLEKHDVEAARERLDECVAEHGRDHPDCHEAELVLRDAQERYDEKAREVWVCDPTQDPCPTPR